VRRPVARTRRASRALATIVALFAIATSAPAQAPSAASSAGPRLSALGTGLPAPAAADAPLAEPPDTGRPRAIEYSEGYGKRLAIHKAASYAELPLFAAEWAIGQSLLNDRRNGVRSSSGLKSAHGIVAGGIGVLFAVNTVTGVWNLLEARHDPNGRTRRTVHGIGMLLADAGFLYTAALGGSAGEDDVNEHGVGESGGDATRHRTAAIASISLATVSTLMMYFWKD
jgi:hypothetical protein